MFAVQQRFSETTWLARTEGGSPQLTKTNKSAPNGIWRASNAVSLKKIRLVEVFVFCVAAF